mmetsp:Transcript_10606/g.48723  ORF Transcript_10606/g.48723 Transcript_10606/m.48723 type:complete len:200 (+) Transcript_10606:977-1576(+)
MRLRQQDGPAHPRAQASPRGRVSQDSAHPRGDQRHHRGYLRGRRERAVRGPGQRERVLRIGKVRLVFYPRLVRETLRRHPRRGHGHQGIRAQALGGHVLQRRDTHVQAQAPAGRRRPLFRAVYPRAAVQDLLASRRGAPGVIRQGPGRARRDPQTQGVQDEHQATHQARVHQDLRRRVGPGGHAIDARAHREGRGAEQG